MLGYEAILPRPVDGTGAVGFFDVKRHAVGFGALGVAGAVGAGAGAAVERKAAAAVAPKGLAYGVGVREGGWVGCQRCGWQGVRGGVQLPLFPGGGAQQR